MSDKLFLNSVKLKGEFFPSWDGIPDDMWQTILKNYFFELADSFGFHGVLETKDLFPKGLHFFSDWKLNIIELVEIENDIVCRFDLKENCKAKLLKFDFSTHEKGMNQPRNYWEFDEEHFYYEFDILYFFKGGQLIGYYINHESMIGFVNNPSDIAKLDSLDESITKFIIESSELEKRLKNL